MNKYFIKCTVVQSAFLQLKMRFFKLVYFAVYSTILPGCHALILEFGTHENFSATAVRNFYSQAIRLLIV